MWAFSTAASHTLRLPTASTQAFRDTETFGHNEDVPKMGMSIANMTTYQSRQRIL